MRLALVLGVLGRLLRVFALAYLAPLILALVDADSASAMNFGLGAVIVFLTGTLLARRSELGESFQRGEALGVVAGTWIVVAGFAAVPYALAGMAPVDAFFESMSGFTTTGATVITDFSAYGRAFYLWRSMTQWFGGVGVIALFVVVLPHLGVGGRQLFFAEASRAPSESVAPKIRSTAMRLWILYVFLTVLLVTLLHLVAGMPLYDSVCHAFTTMPAGGFSPNPQSIGGYAGMEGYNAVVGEWIFVVFMLLAGCSFPLLWIAVSRRPFALFRDGEFRLYFLALTGAALGVSFAIASSFPDLDNLRTAAFQCASLISSTGYASTDYNLWVDSARVLLLFVMIVGGCAGSAAGGQKAIRNLLSLKYIWRELTGVLHPRAVIPLRYKGKEVPEPILRAVLTVVVLYLGGHLLFGVALVLMGADLVTGFSAALACLGNIGPGFGPTGPMGNFSGFPSAGKLMLSAAMWLGRLEIVTVLALLHPHVLGRLRWRDAHSQRIA